MATYAYLRVSTDEQDLESQKHGILEYANAHDLDKVVYVEDTASGKLSWTERKLGELSTLYEWIERRKVGRSE